MLRSIPMIEWALLAALLGVIMILGGCTQNAIIAKVGPKIVGIVAKPILGFAKADAETTLKWVDKKVAAGELTEAQAAEARACPQGIIMLDELRRKIEEPDTVDGIKGLIYLRTVQKFGGDPTATLRGHLIAVVKHCAELAGSDQDILKMIR